MLNSFLFSINSTLPVFLVMVFGMVLRKVGIMSESYASATDKLVFKAALPILLFKDISRMDFSQDFDVKFVAFCFVTSVVMFLAVWLFSVIFIKDKSLIGSFAQGSARGSAAILGIALATNIYGSSGLAPLMILAAVPVFNVMAVIILTVHAQGEKKSVSVKEILKNIITNPIILGILAGLPFCVFEITLPDVVCKTVDSISSVATPMALLSIGASFNLAGARKRLAPSLTASAIKLFVLPLVFLPIAVMMGFRDSALVAVFVMLGSPTTVTCYIMSKNMGNDSVLSSNIVMLATLFSSVSITFWVMVLKMMMLI